MRFRVEQFTPEPAPSMTRLLKFTGPNVAIEPSATEICAPLPAAMPPTGTAITGFEPVSRLSPFKVRVFQ